MRYALILFLGLFFAFPAYADCTGPAGAESATRYDFTAHKLYYCNGTNWVEIGSGGEGGMSSIAVVQQGFFRTAGTVTCPAGTYRTGCNHVGTGNVSPSGTNGCYCTYTVANSTCYAICAE